MSLTATDGRRSSTYKYNGRRIQDINADNLATLTILGKDLKFLADIRKG